MCVTEDFKANERKEKKKKMLPELKIMPMEENAI